MKNYFFIMLLAVGVMACAGNATQEAESEIATGQPAMSVSEEAVEADTIVKSIDTSVEALEEETDALEEMVEDLD